MNATTSDIGWIRRNKVESTGKKQMVALRLS